MYFFYNHCTLDLNKHKNFLIKPYIDTMKKAIIIYLICFRTENQCVQNNSGKLYQLISIQYYHYSLCLLRQTKIFFITAHNTTLRLPSPRTPSILPSRTPRSHRLPSAHSDSKWALQIPVRVQPSSYPPSSQSRPIC